MESKKIPNSRRFNFGVARFTNEIVNTLQRPMLHAGERGITVVRKVPVDLVGGEGDMEG